MQALLAVSNAIYRMLERIAEWSGWLLIVLMFTTCIDVAFRKFGVIGFPYTKVQELEWHLHTAIFALWLGLGIWSKVALGVTLVFFIEFFNVYQGVKEVSPTVLANARMLGMSERQLMRHVYWPSALSWMFSSLHTSVGFAVVGAVVGEYLGSAAGLGYLIQQAEGVFDVAGVFAGMFVLSVFVLAIDALVSLVERRLLAWRPVAETHE